MIVTAGSTNVSVYYYIVGNAAHASPGDPITGLLYSDIETGGSASYNRQGAARVDLTLITLASASAAHSDGGFILVDDTNMPGVYRCDYADATFATGVDQAILSLVVATANNAAVAPILVDITDVDLHDSVRGGMTALPAAAAEGAGGLYTRGTGAGQVNQTANGRISADAVAISGSTVAADNAEEGFESIVSGTCGSASTVTNVVSGLATTTDQYNNKVITFKADTTTTALQGQSSKITATDGSGNLTVITMSSAAVSGDTYIIT